MSDETIQTPDSSNIASYAYSPTRSVLTVEFKNKAGAIVATWEYAKVPPVRKEDLDRVRAEGGSLGKFIRSRIIGYYDGQKVNSER
jgi:hypothetical protein